MRKIVFASIFVLAFCFASFGQNPTCPMIRVSAPCEPIQPGENMTFTAVVEGFNLNKIDYEWSVSEGTIDEGQNTPVIKVNTTGLSHAPITATVKIKSLPIGCVNSASEVGLVVPLCILPMILDEYEEISWKEERFRLSATSAEFQKNTDSIVVIEIYHSSKDSKTTLRNRILRISNFLTQENKIPKERIAFVFGGMEKTKRTRIYLTPFESRLENLDWDKSLNTLNLKNK